MKRGAIELSMSFVVVLLISIIIFGFGIRFIYSLTKQASDLQSMTLEDIDSKISNLVCSGNDKVCIGVDRKTIRKNSFGVFGIKILNVGNSEDFEASSSFSKAISKTGAEFASSRLAINPPLRSLSVGKNAELAFGVGIEVPADAISGTYIFNVEVRTAGNQYVPIQKLYVDVP